MHLDEYGFIVQADGDGGDTAQRTGFYYYLPSAPGGAGMFNELRAQLEIEPGICVRHPYQLGFRSDPSEFSRDQQDPLVITAGKRKHRDFVCRMLKAQVKRFGRYQNKDWVNLQTIGVYVRALNSWYLWPLLCFTDLGLLLQAIIIYFSTRNNPDDVDDLNHILRLQQAKDVLSTPTSYLARKLYVLIRPYNYGNTIKGEDSAVMGTLVWYNRDESGGNIELAEFWRSRVESF